MINIRKEKAKAKEKITPKLDDYGNLIFDESDLKDFLWTTINFEELKERAKEDAARDINNWNSTINDNRKREYHEDFKENAIYATIISLLTMILGRYLLKLIKWTNINKTK